MVISVVGTNQFESYVNSDGCQTMALFITLTRMFESYVNSDGCQTRKAYFTQHTGLRAMLIQMDVKHRRLWSIVSNRFESYVNSE